MARILYLALFALGFAAVKTAKPQPQPTSYNRSQQISRSNFEAFEKSNLHLNSHIPPAPSKGLRIVTFNIHYFRDLHDQKSNLQDVLGDVRAMNADVVLFQEVLADTSKPDRKAFDQALNGMGYKYLHFGAAPSAWLGNMIASKHALHNLGSLDLGYHRIMMEADIGLTGGDKLTLFATHWQSADQHARDQQSKKTVNYFNTKGGSKMGKFVLGADFNAHYMSPAIKGLVGSGLVTNSFNALHWPYPKYTCWAGHAIDFLFAGNDVNKHVVGSYVYHTLSSDHLPIIMDLDLIADGSTVVQQAASTAGAGSNSSSSMASWLYGILAVLVIGGIAFGVYYYFRLRRT